MITPPITSYPVLPAHGADAAYYGRFIAALSEDVAALTALEELLSVYNLHAWRDETGDIWHILARPTVVGGPCDWPWRLKRVGANLELCGGAQALGHGEYGGLNEVPPFALPGQVYGVSDPAPDAAAVATAGAVSVWLRFLHSFIAVHGEPMLSLTSTKVESGSDWPANTDSEMAMPLAFRLGTPEAALFTVAVGAIELRHTPEPVPMDFNGDLPGVAVGVPLPIVGSAGSGTGGGALYGASSGSGGSRLDSSSSLGGALGSESGSSSSAVGSSSSSGSSGSSNSSKIILPVNIKGRLEYVGWCASEAPNQQVEGMLRIPVSKKGVASMPVPAWMRPLAHEARPDWRIATAHSEDGYMVCARITLKNPPLVEVQAIDDTGKPVCTAVTVRVRAASKTSREVWEREDDPARRAASKEFHVSTRRHDKSR